MLLERGTQTILQVNIKLTKTLDTYHIKTVLKSDKSIEYLLL